MQDIHSGIDLCHAFIGRCERVEVAPLDGGDILATFRFVVTDATDTTRVYPIALTLPIDGAFEMARDLTDAFRRCSRGLER